MDRASDYESEGQRFDSSRAHQKTKGLRAMMTRSPLLLSAEYQRADPVAAVGWRHGAGSVASSSPSDVPKGASDDSIQRERAGGESDRRSGQAAPLGAARGSPAHRHEVRLRHGPL